MLGLYTRCKAIRHGQDLVGDEVGLPLVRVVGWPDDQLGLKKHGRWVVQGRYVRKVMSS